MEEKIDLDFLYWIMHRLHMEPVDEYLSLTYIWSREALERYRARDRTTTFSTFLFHFIRCKWSNYRHRKGFKGVGVLIPRSSSNSAELDSIEILADLESEINKDFYTAAVLISKGYSCKEAAETLGIRPTTLYTWINRYRKEKEKKYE